MTRKLLTGACLFLIVPVLLFACLWLLPAEAGACAITRSVVLSDLTVDYDGTAYAIPSTVTGFSSPSFAWYKDEELVSADSSALVVFSQVLFQYPGEHDKHLVTHVMPEYVIDHLEGVQVKHA